VDANRIVDLRSKWENKTTAKIEQMRKSGRVAQLVRDSASQLLARRKELAGLLNAEMDMWQKEFASTEESPEVRKASLQARALELRDAREAERRAFVDEMYKMQWQASCDDGRLLDSKATIKRVMSDRQAQLQQKAAIAVTVQEQEDALMKEWKQRIDELEAKETQKERYRASMEKEIRGMLDLQVEQHQQRKAVLKARQAADWSEELSEWTAAMQKEKSEELERFVTAKARGMETRAFNESRLHIRAEAAAEVRAQDLTLLNYALEKERAAQAAEQAKRDDEKATTRRYQDYLKQQMVKEAQNFATVDALRQAEENKIWAKREQEQQDRHDARSALWKATDQSRQEQMRMKAEREVKELDDGSEFRAHQEVLDRAAADKEAAHKIAVMENLRGINAQKAFKERLGRREVQEKYLETKMMLKVEQEHKARLSEMAGTVQVNFPNKHTQWYT